MKTIRFVILFTTVLFTTCAGAQSGSNKAPVAKNQELQTGSEEIRAAKADMANLLNKMIMVWELKPGANMYTYWANTKGTLVLNDRIEFRYHDFESIVVYFAALTDCQITISYDAVNKFDRIYFSNLTIVVPGKGNGRKFFGDLILIQNELVAKQKSHQDSLLILFEPIAAQYRVLKVKPELSEEQRKYIVQANTLNEEKQYAKAIEAYKKAITVDPVAYPTTYSNMALLSAQINKFDAAIYYMKKYLMLVPEAEDARGAQDKIYGWEAKLGK